MSHYVSYFCVGVTKRPDRNNLRRELFVVVAVVVAHRLRRFSSLLFRPRRLNNIMALGVSGRWQLFMLQRTSKQRQ